jgi:UDP-4-amino-4,6-dideoxy-N-acetyl-beta-L-altrosamine transaminase
LTQIRIPYGWHQVTEDDIAAVAAVMRHGQLTQGEQVVAFERELAAYCGAAHGVACNSASSGLLLACRALGLKPGDGVWTSAVTFVASASCALHCGARVDLVDVDPETGNLSIPALAEKLWRAKRAGRLPRILIPVHFAGRPVEMSAVGGLAAEFGFAVIEDAAHALGAQEAENPASRIGNAQHSDAVVFSFHPVKLLTTGEGGMVMTQDAALAERMARLRSQDIRPSACAGQPDWRYQIEAPGYNFRLSDLQAALGRSQLKRIDSLLERRRALAWRYQERLRTSPLKRPMTDNHQGCAWHLYCIQCPSGALRRQLFDGLRRAGIGVQVHYQPLYRLALFAGNGWRLEDFPGSEAFYAGALSLPLYPDLTETMQDEVIAVIEQSLGRGS